MDQQQRAGEVVVALRGSGVVGLGRVAVGLAFLCLEPLCRVWPAAHIPSHAFRALEPPAFLVLYQSLGVVAVAGLTD